MFAGAKITGNKKMSTTKAVGLYDKPKFVYIPLIGQNDTNITPLVKKGDYVKKGTIVGKRKGNLRIPIHSSVSGTVVEFVEKPYLNGNIVKCVKIENDFKETLEQEIKPRKAINRIKKEEFIQILRDAGIVGLSGNGFPSYVKYDNNLTLKTLIVNATECEPYITADYMLIKEKIEEILEGIDAILEINGMEEAIIAVKKNNIDLLKLFDNYIGTYLKIKVVPVSDKYGIGWEKMLVQDLKHTTYRHLPSEKGIVVNNVSTIYAIYETLKYGYPLTERIVTFTGEMLKHPQNIRVKIGTPVSEVIEFLGGYKRNKKIRFVAGGPMMGKTLINDELIVSANLNCVLVLKEAKEKEESPCMRCGKCIKACPAKLSPVLIKDYKKNKERLKELKPERCISCGLCSYICPARIDVRSHVEQAKKMSKEG